MSSPFNRRSVDIPLVALGNGCKQGDGQGTEVQPFQDVVDLIGRSAVFVDAIECVSCGRCRQRWDFDRLATRRDGGNSRRNANTDIAELSQFGYVGMNESAILAKMLFDPIVVEDG